MDTATRSFERGAERAITVIVGIGALLVAAGSLVTAAAGLVRDASGGSIPLRLVVEQPLPAGIADGTAVIVDGAFSEALVRAGDLDGGTVALLAVARACGALTTTALAGSIAMLAWRLLHGRPFAAAVGTALAIAGGALMAGGLISQGLGGLASWFAIEQLLGDVSPAADPFFPLIATFDPAPLGYGLAITLIALAFEHGRRLQRDTDGLV